MCCDFKKYQLLFENALFIQNLEPGDALRCFNTIVIIKVCKTYFDS